MTTPRQLFLLAGLVLMAAGAAANDTTARIGAGGLEFTKSTDIRMVSEKLSISPSRITVDYVFRNESGTAIETIVAFPMPPYGLNCGQSALDENIRPLASFRIAVDGVPTAPSRLRRAEVDGKDVTAALRDAGLSEDQIFRTFAHDCETGSHVKELSARQQTALRKLSALVDGTPNWKVAETAHWRQTFPAQRDVRVRHDYQPFKGHVGSGGFTRAAGFDGSTDIPVSTLWDDRTDRACVDAGVRRAMRNRVEGELARTAAEVGIVLQDVEYILGTGRNWKGPIADFTLDIVKETPDQVVSLCFPGKPTRVDGVTLRFQQRDFTPPDRLHVNFYSFWKR